MAVTATLVLAANIRAELSRRGLTQSNLAARLNLSQAAVSARLRGVTAFDVDELALIAAFLNLPIDALLSSEQLATAAAAEAAAS